jgi:hypothetical protein
MEKKSAVKTINTLSNLEWALLLDNPKLIYIETPKAACTKIRTLLILLNRGYEDPELAEFLKNTNPAPYYHWEFGIRDNHSLKSKKISLLLESPDYLKFTFVRNPYSRLVSAYTNRICDARSSGHEHYTYISKKIKAELGWNQSGFITRQFRKVDNKINAALPKRRPSSYFARVKFSKSTFDGMDNYNYDEILQTINKTFGKRFPPNVYERASEKANLGGVKL